MRFKLLGCIFAHIFQLFLLETTDGAFAHLYSLLSLNLGCRSSNTAGIALQHISAGTDHFVIQFVHQKNDQEGEMQGYERHIFANPLNPVMCPILALAIYLSIVPFREGGVMLFDGTKANGRSNQDERYLKILKRIIESDSILELLKQHGFSFSEIGSHTSRKTIASYCSSISSIHSHAALVARMGWKLVGVQGTYILMRCDAHGGLWLCLLTV